MRLSLYKIVHLQRHENILRLKINIDYATSCLKRRSCKFDK